MGLMWNGWSRPCHRPSTRIISFCSENSPPRTYSDLRIRRGSVHPARFGTGERGSPVDHEFGGSPHGSERLGPKNRHIPSEGIASRRHRFRSVSGLTRRPAIGSSSVASCSRSP